MNRRKTMIALALGGALWGPAVASASPSADTPAVHIEVEVTVAPETSLPADDETWKTMRTWVTDNQTGVLEDAGFVVSDDAARVIRTEIEVYGEYGVNTKATLTLVGDSGAPRELVCEACKDSEILAKIDDETEALAERLRAELTSEGEHATEQEAVTEAKSGVEDHGEDEGGAPIADDGPTDRKGKRFGVAGYVGFGALAAGVGVAVGGIIVLAEEPSRRPWPGHNGDLELADRVPLGGALAGVGASLIVTGAVLLVVDQTVLRKRRSARMRASALVPVPWSGGAGLSWSARF